MKKHLFFLTVFCFLAGCSVTPEAPATVFIDSNITADVYAGDEKIGVTPFARHLPGKEIAMLTIRREGYKTVALPLETGYTDNYRPGLPYALSDMTSSRCDGRLYRHEKSNGKKDNPMGCAYPFFLTIMTPTYGAGLFIATTDLTPDSRYVVYEKNSFYVDMVPDGKRHYSTADIRDAEIRTFSLFNFPALAAGRPDALESLAFLSGISPAEIQALTFSRPTAPLFADALIKRKNRLH